MKQPVSQRENSFQRARMSAHAHTYASAPVRAD
jgi:hypothetical protein